MTKKSNPKSAAEPVQVVETGAGEADDILSIFSELPSDSLIEVWRVGDESKKMEYCKGYSVEDFSVDKIAADFGGGVYLLKGKVRDGPSGRMTYRSGQRTVKIAGPSVWARPPVATAGLPAGPAPPPPPTMREVLSDTLLASLIERQKAPAPIEWEKIFAGAAGLFATVMGAITTNRKDPMELATQVAALVKKGTSTTEDLALFREGMKFGREAHGGGGSDGGENTNGRVLAVVERAVDVGVKLAERWPKREEAAGGAPPALPASAGVAAAPPESPGSPRLWIRELLPFRTQLVGLPAMGISPDAAAIELDSRLSEDAVNDMITDFEEATNANEFTARSHAAAVALGFPSSAEPWITGVGLAMLNLYPSETAGPEQPPTPAETPGAKGSADAESQ